MIDIHSHILPGIDDGFKTMEESVAGAIHAWRDGTKIIIATPHMKEGFYDNDLSRIRLAVEEMRSRLLEEKIGLELAVGSELYHAAGMVSGIRSGRLATMGETGRYVLLEFPFQQAPVRAEEAIFDLKVAGITPIIAHPERIRYFQEDLDRLERMVRQGALSQLTTSSLTGHFGSRVEALSLEMVRRRMVHFLASDHHDLRYRPPGLSRAFERLAQLVGREQALETVDANPAAVLRGDPIQAAEPLGAGRTGGGGGLLSRLFARRRS